MLRKAWFANPWLVLANSTALAQSLRNFLGSWATPPVLGLSGRNSEKFPERPRKRSQERFLEFPSRARLGSPKPFNSRHLRLPEHFQNYLPPSTAGGASFFRSGSGERPPRAGHGFPSSTGGASELREGVYEQERGIASQQAVQLHGR